LAGCIRQALLRCGSPTPSVARAHTQRRPGVPGPRAAATRPCGLPHPPPPVCGPSLNPSTSSLNWSNGATTAATEVARVCRGSTAVLVAAAFPYLISWLDVLNYCAGNIGQPFSPARSSSLSSAPSNSGAQQVVLKIHWITPPLPSTRALACCSKRLPTHAATDTRCRDANQCQPRRRLGTLWCLRASNFLRAAKSTKEAQGSLEQASLKTNCVRGLDKPERSFLGAFQLNQRLRPMQSIV
jgi:hypothetical protein